MPIVSNLAAKTPILMVRPFVNQRVLGLRSAETMEIQFLEIVHSFELLPRLGLVVATVEKAFAVFGPGRAGKFHPLNLVAQILRPEYVSHFPFLPVRARRGDIIGDQISIITDGHAAQGRGAVSRELVGIEQQPRRGSERVERVKHALVLEAVVPGEEIATAFFKGDAVTLEIPEPGEALFDSLALGDLFEIAKGAFVL